VLEYDYNTGVIRLPESESAQGDEVGDA
jgi:hypothetical protein